MACFGGRKRCDSKADGSRGLAARGIGLRPVVHWALLALVWVGWACAAFFEEPEVRIVGIRVVSLGVSGGTAAVDLAVTNPNDRAIRVVGLRYRLQVEDLKAGEGEWRTLTEGFRSEGVTLEPRDTASVSVDVPFEYRIVGATVRALLQGRDVGYRLDGEVRIDGPVGEIRVPVRTTGLLER